MANGMLIVCSQAAFAEKLCGMIASAVPGSHTTALSGAEARRKTGLSEFAAVIITGRLADENAIDLAIDLAASGCTGVVIVVDREALYEAHEALDGTGVTILVKPITRDALIHSLQFLSHVREGGGTVDKAKLMLMQWKNFSEPQAHRYIQKLSMDRRLPREVAAQMIIRALQKPNGHGSE